VTAVSVSLSGLASEYEVSGNIFEIIPQSGGGELRCSNEFTVFVRDCAWLVRTVEVDVKGNSHAREVGSTNGIEIYEIGMGLGTPDDTSGTPTNSTGHQGGKRTQPLDIALIITNGIPVGQLNKDMVGHIWLMFASSCYWSGQHTKKLTPVYDWHASAAVNPSLKETAEWELLAGEGSLPQEVRYLGHWDETNGLYRVTATKTVGGVLIPTGFTFEERHASRMTHKVELYKRVEAVVTSVQPSSCSLKSLIPVPEGPTIINDFRLRGERNLPPIPNYSNPIAGNWPSVGEAKKQAEARQAERTNRGPGQERLIQRRTCRDRRGVLPDAGTFGHLFHPETLSKICRKILNEG